MSLATNVSGYFTWLEARTIQFYLYLTADKPTVAPGEFGR